MITVLAIIFFVLILCSAFFSSAETAVLSVNRVKLSHQAKKKDRRAQILVGLLERPEDFFSTILIGNNLVNVGAATIATILFTFIFRGNKTLLLVSETIATTLVLLVFAEITPKSFAFRHPEKLAHLYSYPLLLITRVFHPFSRLLSAVSRLLIRAKPGTLPAKKDFSMEEIKHFLHHETQLLQYSPETLRMVSEIIEISQKDLRTIMTPRPAIVALEENEDLEALHKILRTHHFSKIPIYRENLDNITGVIHSDSLLPALLENDADQLRLKQLAVRPVFVSEYSSLHYILAEFRKQQLKLAIVLDEYGVVSGLITPSDILRETIGGLKWSDSQNILKLQKNIYQIRGSLPVEEVNTHLEWDLPEKKEYTTISGLFIYHYGKLPVEKSRIQVGRYLLIVKGMGKRKIEEVVVISNEDHPR